MPIRKTCLVCGKTFSVRPYRAASAQYCSRSCASSVIMANPVFRAKHAEAMSLRRGLPGNRKDTHNKRPHAEEYRQKKREERLAFLAAHPGYMAGEKSPNWKGGSTGEHRTRLTRAEWKRTREKILARDGKCCVCGSTVNLCVHHIKPWRYSRSDELDILMTVCAKHHRQLDVQATNEAHQEAINMYCLQCRDEVTRCTALACPLWAYRPFASQE